MKRSNMLPLAGILLCLSAAADVEVGVPTASQALAEARVEAAAMRHAQVLALLEPHADSESEALIALLAATYLDTAQPERALAVVAELATRDDASAELLFQAGRAALAIGEAARGRDYLERAATDPTSPARRQLGLLDGHDGHFDRSYSLLAPWVEVHPDDDEARLAAASAAVRTGRIDDAERLLAGDAGNDVRAELLAAQVRLARGDADGAARLLEPLLEATDPTLGEDARRLLLVVSVRRGNADDVRRLLPAGAILDPPRAMLLARAQEARGDLAGGLATLLPYRSRLARLGPAPNIPSAEGRSEIAAMALLNARLLAAEGSAAPAIALYRLAVHLEPESSEALAGLAALLEKTGDEAAAHAVRARLEALGGG